MSGSDVQSTSLPSSGPTGDDDVIDIRFNKITYINGTPPLGDSPLPLTAVHYPVTLQTAEFLRQTTAVSVIQQDDCGECDIPPEDLLRAIGGLPSHPPFHPNPNDPYWAQLLEVIQVQQGRLNDADPRLFMPLPKIWDDYDIHQVAEAVHDEVREKSHGLQKWHHKKTFCLIFQLTPFFIFFLQFPGIYHIDLMIQLMGEGMTIDRDIIPSDNRVDFVRSVVVLAELNTWAIGSVGPQNFGIKWYGGRARPEEVAFLIKTGAIPSHHVPMEIRTALENMDFDTAPAFTAYPEGSPRHPSWPAMHSAASAGSMWMGVVMNLTPEQWCETKAVDYGVAYARTVAGVHFPDDNIVGLNLGQELVARKLPGYLAARYGSDPGAVRKKILEMRFDWADYLTSDCFAS